MKNLFLIGERIYLRALDGSDLNGNYIQWLNDEEICKYNSHHLFPYTQQKAEDYLNKVNSSKSELVLAVVCKEDDIHIGNISLQNINFINRSAEFAILFGEKNYWGKGFAKEASFLIIKHGFLELGLNRIYCGMSSENMAMQNLAKYLGMQKEGQRREALFKHGNFFDIVEYGSLNKEFCSKFSLV